MTTDEVLAIVKDRRLRLRVEDGRIAVSRRMVGPVSNDLLLKVLNLSPHREWIIEQLEGTT